MYIPSTLRRRLQPTAQWLPISLPPPQELIEVRLVTLGREFDVSNNNVIAALEPLTIGIGLDPVLQSALATTATPELHFYDRSLARVVGILRLGTPTNWSAGGAVIGLFEVHGGTHHCINWVRRAWDSWMYQRTSRRNPRPGGFSLSGSDLESTMIFYICPRPVFLVTVDDGENNNIFPMDLVGPIAPDRFCLALRNTSPSVETIKRARRLALGSVAAFDHPIAIQLGAHHKRAKIDWNAQPFKVARSREFALPIAASALQVREVAVLDFRTVGSHTLFIGRIVSDERLGSGPQLFHTSGIHQRLRTRAGHPLQAI